MPRWRRITLGCILTLFATVFLWIAMIHGSWFIKGRESQTEMEVYPALRHCIDQGLLSSPSPDFELKSLDHLQNAAKRVGDHLAINPVWPALAFVLCITGLLLLAQPRKHPADPFPAP